MEAQISEVQNIETFMIVWDVNLKITYKVDRIDILLPPFSLNPNKSENTNGFRLLRFADNIFIRSSFSTRRELKGCTTYMINPTMCTVLDVYEGFGAFTWKGHEWGEKMRFVFKVKMQCDSSDTQTTIWKHCVTDMQPAINTNGMLLNLEAETATHTVENNCGVPCVVKRFLDETQHTFEITPLKPSGNWNLLTVMLRKLENNDLEWYYLNTTNLVKLFDYSRRSDKNFLPHVIIEIHELKTSIVTMSDFDTSAITSVIEPHLRASSKTIKTSIAITSENNLQLKPPTETKEMQYRVTILSNLDKYFNANKFCDVTIHIQDQQIRAHKTALSTGSTIWHDLFVENETLATIHVTDFDYETIKTLIAYTYTGKKIERVTEQLLIAADTYGVAGVKDLCEEALIETIEMKTVVNLLVLADRYMASALYDKVVDSIGENYKAFMKLEEAKGMFMMYPELAFKLFAKISLK